MKREEISEAISLISSRHIREAENIRPHRRAVALLGKLAAAAAIIGLFIGVMPLFTPKNSATVYAYSYGTEEEITSAGVIMSTGTITDSGEMTGHPLMFFLAGEKIEKVRYSCKNQLINFMDWTEKRDEYGNAQNFTVEYGEDENEYYFLLIDWIPNAAIRELTDHADSAIATLPEELRSDVIVMEITFMDGRSATKAIHINLRDDGTFFATFDDYRISAADTFVERPDSKPIPRNLLYSEPEITAAFYAEDGRQVEHIALWYNLAEIDTIEVRWENIAPDSVSVFYTPMGTETAEEKEMLMIKVPREGDDNSVTFDLHEIDRTVLHGYMEFGLTSHQNMVMSDIYNVCYEPDMLEEEADGQR